MRFLQKIHVPYMAPQTYLYINLYSSREYGRSTFRKYLGITIMLLSCIPVALDILHGKENSKQGYYLFLFLCGSISFLQGIGINLQSRLGRAYILIDDNKFEMKRSAFSKAETIAWTEIEDLRIGFNKLIFSQRKGALKMIQLDKLSYSDLVKVKQVLTEVKREKMVLG